MKEMASVLLHRIQNTVERELTLTRTDKEQIMLQKIHDYLSEVNNRCINHIYLYNVCNCCFILMTCHEISMYFHILAEMFVHA